MYGQALGFFLLLLFFQTPIHLGKHRDKPINQVPQVGVPLLRMFNFKNGSLAVLLTVKLAQIG